MTPIRVEEISKCYGSAATAAWALQDVSLAVEPGELFFLLGPSGCGKTTLLRIIAGMLAPSGGKIFFGDRDVTCAAIEDRNTALVFQNYALWPHMTVQRNVEFGPKMRGAPPAERARRATDALTCVEMDPYASRKPNQLSGGQQQRVAVARALAAAPEILLLDEPLSNLDARLRLHMRGELRRLIKQAGTTAVYVTHDQKEALSMADRVAVMNDGQIVQVGRPEDLYHHPATRFVADFLGEANFIGGRVRSAQDELEIDTPAGSLRAARADFGQGAAVTCCVRPECLRVLPSGAAAATGEVLLAGTVESTTFLGEIRQTHVHLADGTTWKITALAGGPAVECGQAVQLALSPADVAVLGIEGEVACN